jgi:hypothetical protein
MSRVVAVALLLVLAGCSGLGGPAITDQPTTTAPTTTTAGVAFEDRDQGRYLVVDRADQSEAARAFNSSGTPGEAVRFENLSDTRQERFLEVYSDLDQRVQAGLTWGTRIWYVYYEDTWWEVTTLER